VTKRNGSKTKNPKKQEKKHEDAFPPSRRRNVLFRVLFQQTNKQTKPRMEPQDARIGGSAPAAVRESASAPATPTQHDTMFGAKDAAAVVGEDVDSEWTQSAGP